MNFLFRQALALIGKIDAPEIQKRLFDRFGGGDDLLSLYDKMRKTIEDDRIGAPDLFEEDVPDPNAVAGYLDHPEPKSRYQTLYEKACLDSDPLLAEAACSSIILNLYQEKATRAPKSCRQRLYAIAEGPRALKTSLYSSDHKAPQTASPLKSREKYSEKGTESDWNPFEARYREDLSRKDSAVRDSQTGLGTPHSKRSHHSKNDEQKKKKGNDWFQNLFFILLVAGILYWIGPQILRQYGSSFGHRSSKNSPALSSESSALEESKPTENQPSAPLAAANPLTTQQENQPASKTNISEREDRPKRVLEGASAHRGYFPAGQNPALSLTIPEKNNNVFRK